MSDTYSPGNQKNTTPLISVIMPVYNGETYLDQAIRSVLSQTYQNFEFIIVYKESTDNSFKILQKHRSNDSRIVIIEQKDRGIAAALNMGLHFSKGEFIARMDSDDISKLNRLETQLKVLRNTGADICGCDYTIIDEQGKSIKAVSCPATDDQILISLTIGVPFAHPTVMIRKSFLQQKGLTYNSSLKGEDLGLWNEMYRCGAHFVNVPKDLFGYRFLRDSLSRRNRQLIRRESDNHVHGFVIDYKDTIIEACRRVLQEPLSGSMQRVVVKSALLVSITTRNPSNILMILGRLSFFEIFKATASLIKWRIW